MKTLIFILVTLLFLGCSKKEEPEPIPENIVFTVKLMMKDSGDPVSGVVRVENLDCEYDFSPTSGIIYTDDSGIARVAGSSGKWQFWAQEKGKAVYECQTVKRNDTVLLLLQ